MLDISPAENIVVVRVAFDAYASLAAAIGDFVSPRMAYDGAALELMSPPRDHERYNRLLEGLVMLVGDEWNVDIASIGSTRLQAESRGAEPDSSFYIDKPGFRRDAPQLDPSLDPPPDLAVEIDRSRSRIDKRSIYAAFGIREFWNYDGALLGAFALVRGAYELIASSRVIANLPIEILGTFLERRSSVSDKEIRRAWRAWLHANRP